MATELNLRQANLSDADRIWEILQQAIQKRKEEGSDQWQNGYPNLDVVKNDISNGFGYIIENVDNLIIGYIAIIDEIEPAYTAIEGKWLNDDPYIVIHRLAIAQDIKIKGLGTWAMDEIEKIAITKKIQNIKVDTNFDNIGMLRVFEKLGYHYCGEVYFDGSPRKAFHKIILHLT
ncbi:GNAT family N-acetyltransferase [Empedobacter tilapiae]|uniref:GNAT family N-acetyltransferase n=1 Tax=Empedobacter tilapiae TaxID=2491114 RepID=UPI0028D1B13B|nr:GNAT family N-acetyltransferase [Empedobacter tilapiae]